MAPTERVNTARATESTGRHVSRPTTSEYNRSGVGSRRTPASTAARETGGSPFRVGPGSGPPFVGHRVTPGLAHTMTERIQPEALTAKLVDRFGRYGFTDDDVFIRNGRSVVVTLTARTSVTKLADEADEVIDLAAENGWQVVDVNFYNQSITFSNRTKYRLISRE